MELLAFLWKFIVNVIKNFDPIAFLALIIAVKTYRAQQFGVEVIVYPYQEKHGDYGIAIENTGKGTAVDYTFKVLDYDENTKPEIKRFLDTHKLLNGEARITLAGGKIHKIKLENQITVTLEREEREERERQEEQQEGQKEYFPTIEIQIQKREHHRQYKVINSSTICDLKAFDDYPYTENPIDVLRRDTNHQADRQARRDRFNRGLPRY